MRHEEKTEDTGANEGALPDTGGGACVLLELVLHQLVSSVI